MRRLCEIASCLLALTPRSAGPSDSPLEFAPQRGAALEKQFDFELRLRCASWTIDGASVEAPSFEARLESSARITDRYEVVERGSPRDFVRRFDALAGRWWYGDSPTDISGFYSLTGEEIRFRWDAELGDYERTLLDGAASSGLACVAPDMDLRGFLPVETVAEGAKWSAGGPAVIDALWASTELGWCAAPESSFAERLVQQVLLPPFRDLAAAKVRVGCVYTGKSPAQGRDIHRVALRVDERIESDLTELANRFLHAGDGFEMRGPIERLTTRWELAGKGALDWNARGGHFHSFGLDLDVALDVRCEHRLGAAPVLLEMRWIGSAEWSSCAESIHER